MGHREYFLLGCKLFGVYCLFLGLPALADTIPTFFSTGPLLDESYRQALMARNIATRLIPLIYIFGGLYLLRSSDRLHRFAFGHGEIITDGLEMKFTLFIKFLGIFLFITYVPDLLQVISSYLYNSNAPGYLNTTEEKAFFLINLASSLWVVFFGLYLLRGGNVLIRSGMKALWEKT